MRKILIFDYTVVARELLESIKTKNCDYVVDVACRDEISYLAAIDDGYSAVQLDLMEDKNLLICGVGRDVTDLFCVSDSDEENLYVTLSARQIDSNINILAKASDADSKKKLILAGANEAIDFNEIGANRAFHILHRPTVLSFLDSVLGMVKKNELDDEYELAQIEIEEGSSVEKRYLLDLELSKRFDVIVLGVLDNQISKRFIFNLNSFNHFLDAKDVLVVIGKKDNIEKLRKECMGVTV